MRAIWTGTINFAQIQIPIKLYTATDPDDTIKLNQVHRTDNGRIRHLRICEKDGAEVPYSEVARAFEYADDEYIILDEADFEQASDGSEKSIQIGGFVLEGSIDVRYLEKPFYLEPATGGSAAYSLLRAALRRSSKLAIARFTLRGREHLAVVKPVGRVLVLNQMRFPSDLRSPGGLNLPLEGPNEHETELAVALIDRMTRPFNIESYRDTYTDALQAVISSKLHGQLSAAPAKTKAVASANLQAALEASLQALSS